MQPNGMTMYLTYSNCVWLSGIFMSFFCSNNNKLHRIQWQNRLLNCVDFAKKKHDAFNDLWNFTFDIMILCYWRIKMKLSRFLTYGQSMEIYKKRCAQQPFHHWIVKNMYGFHYDERASENELLSDEDIKYEWYNTLRKIYNTIKKHQQNNEVEKQTRIDIQRKNW